MNREQRRTAKQDAKRRRVTLAVLQALAWGVGAALGVGGGALLTVASGSGAPGTASLDRVDLVVLPLFAGLAVFVTALLVQSAKPRAGRRAAPRSDFAAQPESLPAERPGS